LQVPSQLRLKQEDLLDGGLVGVEVGIGDGSAQTNPNHPLNVHVAVFGELVGVILGGGGGEVIACDSVVVVSSLHPQIYPGVLQSTEVGAAVVVAEESLQPNHPGVLQVVDEVLVDVAIEDDVVARLDVVVVSSLQPNHPGVLQVVVEVVVVVVTEVLVIVPVPEVVSSRHPHHPGV
jgi:hypothetical protein